MVENVVFYCSIYFLFDYIKRFRSEQACVTADIGKLGLEQVVLDPPSRYFPMFISPTDMKGADVALKVRAINQFVDILLCFVVQDPKIFDGIQLQFKVGVIMVANGCRHGSVTLPTMVAGEFAKLSRVDCCTGRAVDVLPFWVFMISLSPHLM